MPIKVHYRTATISGFLTDAEIDELVDGEPGLRVCGLPGSVKNWERLDERVFQHRPDLVLSVHFEESDEDCSLEFLRKVPSVRRLQVFGPKAVRGLEFLSDLPDLRELVVRIRSLVDFGFLAEVNPGLVHLRLDSTSSKRPSLEPVAQFGELRRLMISGHVKGIGALRECRRIEHLELNGLKRPDLKFLQDLDGLRVLSINLGSLNSVEDLPRAVGLEDLELSLIRGLQSLSPIAKCRSLRRLRLERLAGVCRLPEMEGLTNLRELRLDRLANLSGVAEIARAPALQKVVFSGLRHLVPRDLLPALDAPSLTAAHASFGNRKQDAEFRELASERGLEAFEGWDLPGGG